MFPILENLLATNYTDHSIFSGSENLKFLTYQQQQQPQLKQHHLHHFGNQSEYECPRCKGLYDSKDKFKKHVIYCSKEKKFGCPCCVYRTKRKDHIYRHMSRLHPDEYNNLMQNQLLLNTRNILNQNNYNNIDVDCEIRFDNTTNSSSNNNNIDNLDDDCSNSIWTLVEALPTSTALVTPQTTHTVLLQIPASMAASAGLQNNIQLQTLIPTVTATTTGTTLTTQSMKTDKDIKTNYTVQEIHTIEAIEEISPQQLHELQTHEQQQLQQHQQHHHHQNEQSQHIKSRRSSDISDDVGMYTDITHLEQESEEYNKETTIKSIQTSNHHQQSHKSITTKGKIVISNPKTSTVKQFKIPATPVQIQQQRQQQQQQEQQTHQLQQFSNSKGKYDKSEIKNKEITITSVCSATKIKSELPFVCDQCGKPYKIKGSLKRHKIYECGVVPSLQCNYCTHRSKYKSDLKKHILQKHPDVYEVIE